MGELKKCQPGDINVTDVVASLDPFRRLEGTFVFSGTLNTELSAQGLEGSVLGGQGGLRRELLGGHSSMTPLKALTSPPRMCLGPNQDQSTAPGARGPSGRASDCIISLRR